MPLSAGFSELPRNEKIKLMVRWGISYREAGEHFGISKQMAERICKERYICKRTRIFRAMFKELFATWSKPNGKEYEK